jgi:uncharacterized protein (TIRG00374 family)
MHLKKLTFVNKYLKFIIGGVISAAGIYLAFKGEDFGELKNQIKSVNLMGFIAANILIVLSCFVRAYRWKLIIDPVENISFHKVFSATMVGYFGNGILAFRLGELLRAYSVTSGQVMSATQAFGTVILERILDLLMVLLVFILLIPWFPFEQDGIRLAIYIFSGTTLVIIIGIVLSIKLKMVDKIGSMKYFSKGSGEKVFNTLAKIFDGAILIKDTNHAPQIIFSSIFLWSFYFVTYILLDACGIPLDIVGSGILLVLGSVAIGIPALPGSAGTYDAGIKFSLMVVFGIASDQALTYAIVSHAVSYFPLVILGGIYFMAGNVNIKDVKKESLSS